MNVLKRTLITAGLVTGLGLTAFAQTPPPAAGPQGPQPGMMRHDPAQMQQRMAKRMAEHQAALKQKLNLSAGQEAAWATWTAAMQPPAGQQRPDRAEFEKLTTPERIDRMRSLRAERNARMDQRADATKAFYAALTAEQKKVFDSETLRGGRGGHFGFGGGHGGHRGHHGHHG